MAEKECKSCSECIHHEICYKIEHFGRDLESTSPCEQFLGKNDVETVKRGHWIYADGIFKCSICNYEFEHEGYTQFFNFCPNCGAKMNEVR